MNPSHAVVPMQPDGFRSPEGGERDPAGPRCFTPTVVIWSFLAKTKKQMNKIK